MAAAAFVIDIDFFDGAFGRAHPEFDFRAFKGGTRRSGAGQNAVVAGQNDFAVGADIDGEGIFGAFMDMRTEDHAHGIGADIAGDVGQQMNAEFGIESKAHFSAAHFNAVDISGNKGRGSQISGIHAGEKFAHGGVAHDGGFVDHVFIDTRFRRGAKRQVVHTFHNFIMELSETFFAVVHGVGDTGNDIGAENILGVGFRRGAFDGAVVEVDQQRNHGGGADIENDTVFFRRRIAGFHPHHLIAVHHHGDFKTGVANGFGDRFQQTAGRMLGGGVQIHGS